MYTDISPHEVAKGLIRTADSFSEFARDTILMENFGKHHFELELLNKHLRSGKRILDIGGGVGVNLLALKNLNIGEIESHLIDQFEEYTDDNRMGSSNNGVTLMEKAGIAVSQHDFWLNKDLPYQSDYFDVITILDVVEHLPGHPLALLREIKRVLKPQGTIIMSGPNSIALMKRLKLLFGKHPYMPFETWCTDQYFSHFREYSPAEYPALLAKAGFREIQTKLISEPTKTRLRNRYYNGKRGLLSPVSLALFLNYLAEIVFPNLRPSVYCVAKKV